MKSKIKNLFAVVLFAAAIFTGCKEDPILPTVVTKDATGIKGDYATLHGEIRNSTDEENYKCGFFYDVSAEMSSPKDIEAKSDARFFAKVTGLLSNTTYYYKAYIRCSEGLIEGETLTFTSQAAGPSVETRPASDVTGNGATLNAAIPSNGGSEITSCGFYYSTSESMSNKATAQFAGTPDSLFSVPVSNLHGNTTYYYKAFAKNVFGTAEGEIMRFTTGIGTPTVQTGEATNIAAYSATLVGNVTSDGGATVTERGFVYGTSASDLSQAVQSGSGMGSFTKAIAGLTASTTYYYKAYATNSVGTAYGEIKEFVFSATAGNENGHVFVDLGLSSGTKWATCNVGANNPEGYGDYFAWGETTPKETYNWSTYRYCNGDYNKLTKYCNNAEYGNDGFTDALTTLEASDDAATANWGSVWRMPTQTELNELKNSCTVTWVTYNGVNGRLFTGPNGNSVFLPAAGRRYVSELYYAGSYGHYWSSSLCTDYPYDAWYLDFRSGNYVMNYNYYRYSGHSVRPVCVSAQN